MGSNQKGLMWAFAEGLDWTELTVPSAGECYKGEVCSHYAGLQPQILNSPCPTSKFHNPSQHPLSFLLIDIYSAPIYNKRSCSHWYPCMSKHDHQRLLVSDYKAHWYVLIAQQWITQIPNHEPILISNDIPMSGLSIADSHSPTSPPIIDSPNHWPPLIPVFSIPWSTKVQSLIPSDCSSHPWSKGSLNHWWPKAFL